MGDDTVISNLRTERRLGVLIQSVHDSVCLSGQATSQDRKLYGLQQLRGLQNVNHLRVNGTDHVIADVQSILLERPPSETSRGLLVPELCLMRHEDSLFNRKRRLSTVWSRIQDPVT